MSLDEKGFLSSEMKNITAKTKEKFELYFSLYEELNIFAQSIVFQLKVNNSNLTQVLISSLYLKVLSSYQSIFILCENGLPSESKIILRSMFENIFKIAAFIKDNTLAVEYLNQDFIHQKKNINKLIDSNPKFKKSVPKLEETVKENKDIIAKKSIKERGPQYYAQKSNLIDYYNTAYSLLSDSTHTNVRDLEKLLVFDDDFRIKSFKWGANDDELDFVLLSSIEVVLMSIFSIKEIFEINNDNKYEMLYKKFNNLKSNYFKTHT